VQVDAPPRELVVHARLRHVAAAAERLGIDPEQVERGRLREALQQVGAGDAPAAARLVDDDGRARQLARVAVAGVRDAVLDHARGRRAGVPEEVVEVRDVDEREIAPVGGGMAHLGDAALRRVVLQVDRGDLAARPPAAEPPLGEPFQLVRALEDHDVDVRLGRLPRRQLDGVRRPLPRLRATAAVGPAVRQDGDQDAVGALHEGGGPRAVHVPQQDVHAATSSAAAAGAGAGAASRSTASSTTASGSASMHG
jgi:hypothetical protein